MVFASCDTIFKKQEIFTPSADSLTQEQVVGEKDAHGCIPSAGYTWSFLKQDCIRVFEVGYRLNPIDTLSEDQVVLSSAFILFNDDKSKAELFIAPEKEGVVLEKNKNIYQSQNYSFDPKAFVLYINQVKKYEAAKTVLKNIQDIDQDAPSE